MWTTLKCFIDPSQIIDYKDCMVKIRLPFRLFHHSNTEMGLTEVVSKLDTLLVNSTIK